MLSIARVVCGAAFAAFFASSANAAVVADFPLNNPGDAFSYHNVSTDTGTFTDEYSVTLGNDLTVGANVAGTGVDNLMMSLYDFGHNLITGGVTSLSQVLTTALSPYYVDVTGNRLTATSDYTLSVSASAAPVGQAPIPGAALLLGSGLAVLYGASRKKIGRTAGAAKA